MYKFFVLGLLVCFLSACAANTAKVDTHILTPQEKEALQHEYPFSDNEKRFEDNRTSEDKRYGYVAVIDGPNPNYRLAKGRCVSGMFLPPFSTNAQGKVTIVKVLSYLRAHGIRISYDPVALPPETSIQLYFPQGLNLCQLVDVLKGYTSGDVRIEHGNTLVISPFERSVWHLPMLGNVLKSQATLESQTSSDTGSTGGESLRLQVADENSFDLAKSIDEKMKKMLPDASEGYWVYDKSLGLLTIYARPRKMEIVRSYLKELARDISRMARVRITIFEINSNKNKERGLDWTLALRRLLFSKPWKYGLTNKYADITLGSAAHDLIDSSAYSLGMASIEDANRVKLIYNLLSKYTDVTLLENTEVLLLNGHPALVSRGREREYLSEVTRDILGDTASVSYQVEKGRVYSGIKIYLNGNIRNDSITLSMFMELQELVNMENFTLPDYTIQNPIIDKRHQTLTIQAEDGETEVVVGIASTNAKIDTSGLGFRPLDEIIGQKAASAGRSWLLIMVTPHILSNQEVMYEVSQ